METINRAKRTVSFGLKGGRFLFLFETFRNWVNSTVSTVWHVGDLCIVCKWVIYLSWHANQVASGLFFHIDWERQLQMDANAVINTSQHKGALWSFSLDTQELCPHSVWFTKVRCLYLHHPTKCVECTFFLHLSPLKLVCILNPELFTCITASLQSVGTLQRTVSWWITTHRQWDVYSVTLCPHVNNTQIKIAPSHY